MNRALAIAALMFVAACSQQDKTPAAGNVSTDTAEATSDNAPAASLDAGNAVPTLAGEWRVAAVNGKPAGASAVAASFQDGKASLASGCFRRAWSYTQKRNVVAFSANPGGSANCGGEVPSEIMQSAEGALGDATMAIFTDNGSEASLSGYGGIIKLERR